MSDDLIPSESEIYYQKLHAECGKILATSFKTDNESCSISHHFILDFEKWIEALGERPEVNLLKMALREYQYSHLALLIGQYRQSFMALRLFLELTLSAVHFSANELDFRTWQRNDKDINWSMLIDSDKGIFSKNFIQAFNENFVNDAYHYKVIAGKVYRECSEYVHGNAYTHIMLPDKLEFIEKVFFDWQEKASSVRLIVTFAFSARYLYFLNEDNRNLLEPIIMDELGHLDVIRSFFGGTTEDE